MAIAKSDGSIVLTTSVDTSGTVKGMNQIKSVVKSVGAAIGVAFGVGTLVSFGKAAIQLASDLEEVQNVVDVAFGDMSYKIEQFAKTSIETLGISELTAKRTASTYMAMAKGMGIAEDAASDMAISLTQLTADIASFYNISQERADVILKSVFTGETETLKQLGIVMTEVNLENFAMSKGITKNISAMTQQEKTILRYQYVLEQTRLAQGDFIRTQDSWANQTRILSERWKEIKTVFGEAFINIATLLLPAINSLAEGMKKVAYYVREVSMGISAAFGGQTENTENSALQADSIEQSAENQQQLTDNIKDTNKELKKSLANFDDIDILSGTIEGANIEPILPETKDEDIKENIKTKKTKKELSAFEKEIKKLVEKIQKAFEPLTKINFSNLIKSLANLKTPIENLSFLSWDIIKDAIRDVITPLAEFVIEDALPRFFDTFGNAVDGFKVVIENAWNILRQFIVEFLDPLWKYAEPKILEIFDSLSAKYQEFTAALGQSEAWTDFQTIMSAIYQVLEPIGEALLHIITPIIEFKLNSDFLNLQYAFKSLEDVLGAIAALIRGDFSDAWKHLKEYLIDDFVDNVNERFISLNETIKKLTGIDLLGWLSGTWENVKRFWNEHIAPIFTKEFWANLAKKAGNGLISGFESAVNGIIGIFEKMLNWIIGGLNKISFDVPDWVPGIGGKTFGFDIPEVNFGRVSIPRLAKGAVIPGNREFLAVLGDQPAGQTNIEAPLQTIVEAFQIALDSRGGYNGGNTEVVLEIDGREFGRAVVEQGNKENRRIGTRLVIA